MIDTKWTQFIKTQDKKNKNNIKVKVCKQGL